MILPYEVSQHLCWRNKNPWQRSWQQGRGVDTVLLLVDLNVPHTCSVFLSGFTSSFASSRLNNTRSLKEKDNPTPTPSHYHYKLKQSYQFSSLVHYQVWLSLSVHCHIIILIVIINHSSSLSIWNLEASVKLNILL